MPYYAFAWVASALYGLEVIFGKLVSKYLIKNPWLFNFIWNLVILIGLAIVTLSQEKIAFPHSWTNVMLGGLFYALGASFYILALYRLDVSVLSPLYNFRTAFAVILGALFLGELLSFTQFVLVTVVFVAGMFVSLDEKWNIKSFFNKSIAIALADMAALALMALFTNKAIHEVGFWPATFWTAAVAQIILLATVPWFWQAIKELKSKHLVSVSAMALTGVISTVAVNKAYQENIGITAVIISVPISMLMAVLFSIFKPELLEKHSAKVYTVRFIAVAIMIWAAIKLSV